MAPRGESRLRPDEPRARYSAHWIVSASRRVPGVEGCRRPARTFLGATAMAMDGLRAHMPHSTISSPEKWMPHHFLAVRESMRESPPARLRTSHAACQCLRARRSDAAPLPREEREPREGRERSSQCCSARGTGAKQGCERRADLIGAAGRRGGRLPRGPQLEDPALLQADPFEARLHVKRC